MTYKTQNSENGMRDISMKENEDDTHPTWKDRRCSWVRRVRLVQMIPCPWGNPQSGCHSSQNIHRLSQTSITKNSEMCLETQKNLESVHMLFRKKCRLQTSHAAWFPTRLQTYHHQDSMLLAHKTSHRSKEENREPRKKAMLVWSICLWQRRWEGPMGTRPLLQWIVLGKLDRSMHNITLDSFLVPPTRTWH